MKKNLKKATVKVCTNVPTFQHAYNNNNKKLIINTIYMKAFVGTLIFCWNTLEHICNKFYKVAGSVGTLKPFRGHVGTFQQNLRL